MNTLFVPFKVSLFTMAFLLTGTALAQERTTKETKVIVVINEKSDTAEHIELLANFQKLKREQLREKYAHHNFFLGVLKGSYTFRENWILPSKNTTIIMYTDKQLYPLGQYYQGDNLAPGDEFDLGDAKAKVVAYKQGELTLKTQ